MFDFKTCLFCGEENPEMVSGPCIHTNQDLFMAQVHCRHCGARGAGLTGQANLALAEFNARRTWNEAHPAQETHVSRISSTAEISITFALIALAISYGLYDGLHGEAIFGYLLGSASLRILLFAVSAYRQWRDRKTIDVEVERLKAA
jgi:hypothetical protein